jgi:formate dehydrogenase accessory protein FdhD
VPVIRIFGEAPALDREIVVGGGTARWSVPEETPVAFIYNGRNHAVMLASPSDLADLAVGFSLTERVVGDISEIEGVDIHQEERGVDLRISIRSAALERLDVRQQRRNIVGRAGCGVCGVENSDVFFEALPKVASALTPPPEAALLEAARGLAGSQPLNARTRTVHAAAWAGFEGEITLAREDVGRHNALDKLLGAMVLSKSTFADGFVVMSSRCSYEIVEKAARLGVKAILTMSGPTAFAIRKANEANLALFARSGEGVVYVN